MDNKYFKPMDDLVNTDVKKKASVDYFKPAGDLVKEEKKDVSMKSYFKPMDDLTVEKSKLDEINDYLLTVVSGKKYPPVCELGVLMGSGRMVINLEQLKELVDSGHNIVWARVINADREMIEVEVQRYEYDEEKMERWRRF